MKNYEILEKIYDILESDKQTEQALEEIQRLLNERIAK